MDTLHHLLVRGIERTALFRDDNDRADFVAWDLQHPNELAYWFGRNPCRRRIVAGVSRAGSTEIEYIWTSRPT